MPTKSEVSGRLYSQEELKGSHGMCRRYRPFGRRSDVVKLSASLGVLWIIIGLAIKETGQVWINPSTVQQLKGPVDTTPISPLSHGDVGLHLENATKNALGRGPQTVTENKDHAVLKGSYLASLSKIYVSGRNSARQPRLTKDWRIDLVIYLPQDSGCVISVEERHGDLFCHMTTYKRTCELHCHEGYSLGMKTMEILTCDMEKGMWEPELQACNKDYTPQGYAAGRNSLRQSQLTQDWKRDPVIYLTQNTGCVISVNERHGDVFCYMSTYEKTCQLLCHPGYSVGGKPTEILTCNLKNNTWNPELQACKKDYTLQGNDTNSNLFRLSRQAEDWADLHHSRWCVHSEEKHGDMFCHMEAYKETCHLKCYPGYFVGGKLVEIFTCYMKTKTWEPELQTCEKDYAGQEAQASPTSEENKTDVGPEYYLYYIPDEDQDPMIIDQ